MRGKKASLAILLLATLLAAFAATGTAPAVAYTSGAVSGDKITYDGTNWKSLSDAAASGDTVGDVTVDGTLPVTIPEGLKVTGSIYNDKGVLLTVNGEQELNVESSDINVRGVFVSGDKSAVSFGNFNSVSVSADNGAGRGLYAGFGGSVSGDLSSVTVKASAGARGIFAYNSDMKLKMNGDMLVSSPNNYADGIRADNGSSVDVSGLKSMTVTAGSGNAEGILTNRSNVSIKMNGDMSVSSSNSYADGIWVSNGSSVDISGLKSITVKASSDANSTAVAVAAVIYSKLNLAMDGDTYVSNTSGANVFGITSELGASLNLAGMKSLVVSSNRGNAYGINAFHSSLSSDLAHLTVTAGSGYADGILTNSSDASLKMNGDMLVSSSNNYANGIWAYNGSSVDVYGLKSMTVTAGNGYADGVKTNSSDASLKMNGDMLVSSSNNYADGIWADNGSSVDVSGLKSMAVSANISNETDYATGASVSKRSKLNLTMDGDMSVHNTGLAYGATADGGSTMNFSGIKAMAVSSDNGTAYGVSASNSSAVNGSLSSMTVQADGNANGVKTDSSDISLNMNGDMSVSSSNGYANGIWARNNSSGDVSGLKSMAVSANISNETDSATGAIVTERSKLNLAMDGDMSVHNTGLAYGATVDGGSTMNFSGIKAMAVSSDNGTAYGVSASNSSAVNGSLSSMTVQASGDANGVKTDSSDISLNMNGDMSVYAAESGALGIMAQNNSNVKFAGVKALTVSSDNGQAYGIHASDSSVSGGLDSMKVSAKNSAYGVSAYSSSADLIMNGDISVYSAESEAYGVQALKYSGENASVKFAGVKAMSVSSDSDYYAAYGIRASDSTVSGSLDSMKVSAKYSAYGVYADSSSADLIMNGDMFAYSAESEAYGIKTENNYGRNTSVKFTGVKAMSVSSDNSDAYGISASNSSSVGGSLDSMKVSAKYSAYGVYAGSSSADLLMNGDMSVYSAESEAYGVQALNSSNVKFDGVKALTVSSDNGYAFGINAYSSTVNGSLDSMKVSAKYSAYGVYAGSNSSANLLMNGDMSVYSAESEANGVKAENYSGENAFVKFAGVKAMSVSSDSDYYAAYGISASNGSTANGSLDSMKVSAKYSAYGVYADSSSVDVTMTGDMTVKGSRSSTAIDAEYGSTVTVTGAARHKIAIDSEVSTDSVLRLSNGSTINVSNADVLNLGNAKVNSITAENYGSRSGSDDIVNASNSYIKGNVAFYDASGEDSESYTGPSFVTGVSSESNGGSLTVNLKDGSTLEGAANAYDGYAPGITRLGAVSTSTGAINFNVDNASNWLVTGDSNLGQGTLANNGTVAFSEDGVFKTVYVNKLAGVNGVYEMSTNGTNSDQIIAETKDSSASGVIYASAKSGVAATYQKRVATPFITVKNEESTSFTLAGGSLSIGAWNYVLRSGLTAGGQTEWYLASDPQNPVSPLALAATAAVVMPDVWYLETNALYSQANSFNADREDTTVWGQAVYNKTEWDNAMSAEGAAAGLVNADGNEVTQKFYGLTGGIDKRIKTDKGQWFAGWMIGYGEGDLDFTGGDGDLDSFHTGLYTVYRTDNDWYLAALAKYNSYKTSVTARTNKAAYDGEYTQNGWGLSFLAGKQFVKDSGWYLEPQFELGWHRTAGADYEIYGLPVDVESMTSLRARAGLGFGRKRVYDNGRSLEFFVRASVVKEFDGDTNVRFFADQTKTAFDPFKVDYSGTWGQYKLGLNYYAPDKGFTLHGALTYENGGDRESPVGLELGGSWNIGPKAEETTEE